jgi:hypothetical protein
MLCLFTLFSKLYSLHPNIYYRAKFYQMLGSLSGGPIFMCGGENVSEAGCSFLLSYRGTGRYAKQPVREEYSIRSIHKWL